MREAGGVNLEEMFMKVEIIFKKIVENTFRTTIFKILICFNFSYEKSF